MRRIIKVTDDMTSEQRWEAHERNADVYFGRLTVAGSLLHWRRSDLREKIGQRAYQVISGSAFPDREDW